MKIGDNVFNIFDDEICKNYLFEARCGNKTKQKILYETLKSISKPITYSYYNLAKRCGINYQDLEDINLNAFFLIFKKYDENLGPLVIYYKYVYSNLIKDEIRASLRVTRIQERSGIGLEKDSFEGEYEYLNYIDDNDEILFPNEIVNFIFETKEINLTSFEREVMNNYLNLSSFSEVAKKMNLKYHVVTTAFNNGARKIRQYFKFNIPEIYKELNKK